MLRRVYTDAATQIRETGLYAVDTDAVSNALRTLYRSLFLDTAARTHQSVSGQKGYAKGLEDEWIRLLEERLIQFMSMKVKHITDATQRDIFRIMRQAQEDGVNRDVIARRIESSIPGMVKRRAKVIAATEQTGAQNAGAYYGALSAGATEKEWMDFKDGRERDSHRRLGRRGRIPIHEPFEGDNGKMDFPGDVSHSPNANEVVNCRCDVLYY